MLCSSDPSPQSFSPSHTHVLAIHLLLLQVKKFAAHVVGRRVGQFTSSEPSPQSSKPSQRHGEQVAPGNDIKALMFMTPGTPCRIMILPPPSLFLISNIPLVLTSDTYK
uniref:Uncharacterized protein n=1 Tax=Nothobranchius furzeri TaxID=105023 RepID=A0A8C6P6D2_NOTFU